YDPAVIAETAPIAVSTASATAATFHDGLIAEAMAAPMARPVMNAATIAANAYDVGPSATASSRVNVTSSTSVTKPAAAAVVMGSHAGCGAGTAARASRRLFARVLADRCGADGGASAVLSAAGSAVPAYPMPIAAAAAATFSAMPMPVVARRPSVGISTNPV